MKLAAILLAAGNSRRYGENKLLAHIDGQPMYLCAFSILSNIYCCKTVVVSQYVDILTTVNAYGFTGILNENSHLGVSQSIILGLNACSDCDAFLFMVCDQPHLTIETVQALITLYQGTSKGLACVSFDKNLGNPCIFSKAYLPELLALQGDVGGKSVIQRHLDDLATLAINDPIELLDIDTK